MWKEVSSSSLPRDRHVGMGKPITWSRLWGGLLWPQGLRLQVVRAYPTPQRAGQPFQV